MMIGTGLGGGFGKGQGNRNEGWRSMWEIERFKVVLRFRSLMGGGGYEGEDGGGWRFPSGTF